MNTIPAANIIVSGIFLLCLATLVAGALIAVMNTRLIRSVCGLAICCVGLAGLFYFLRSPLLTLMEILIYIGAVCITIVFAVMLAEPDEPTKKEARTDGIVWGAISFGVAAAVFWGLWSLGSGTKWVAIAPQSRLNTGSIADIGKSLLTTYSLAFEMISLALLVAILGALAIAHGGRTKS